MISFNLSLSFSGSEATMIAVRQGRVRLGCGSWLSLSMSATLVPFQDVVYLFRDPKQMILFGSVNDTLCQECLYPQ